MGAKQSNTSPPKPSNNQDFEQPMDEHPNFRSMMDAPPPRDVIEFQKKQKEREEKQQESKSKARMEEEIDEADSPTGMQPNSDDPE